MSATADLTLRETAELAGVSKAVVEKAVEARVIATRKRAPRLKGGGTLYVSVYAVAYFAALKRAELVDLPVKHKKAIWTKLLRLRHGDLGPVEFARGATLDVATLAAGHFEAATRYRATRDAHIVSDPDILGGTPVIRGTRLTVYAVLARLKGGETVDDFAADYPDIPREAFEAAALFAEAHPRRGRPDRRRFRNAA
ncbi:MAG: DUF433 domain-containing protein [Inquilinus sp.]|nr:DUF433 domain-containing protein [Inquilinus sp.]